MDDNRVPQTTSVNQSPDRFCHRLEPSPHRLHQEDVILFGEGDEGAELGCVGGSGFLEEDMLSGKNRRLGSLIMVCMGCTFVIY